MVAPARWEGACFIVEIKQYPSAASARSCVSTHLTWLK